MKANMGKMDRVLRFLTGVIIAALYFSNIISGTVATVLMIVAIAFMLTSFVGFCPVYTPFRISTKRKSTKTA